MLRRLIVVLVPGVLTSLIASWLLSAWSSLDIIARITVSAIAGVLTIAFLIFLTRERDSESPFTRVASGLKSRGKMLVERVKVVGTSGNTDVASGITSQEGDVTVADIDVRRGTDADATN